MIVDVLVLIWHQAISKHNADFTRNQQNILPKEIVASKSWRWYVLKPNLTVSFNFPKVHTLNTAPALFISQIKLHILKLAPHAETHQRILKDCHSKIVFKLFCVLTFSNVMPNLTFSNVMSNVYRWNFACFTIKVQWMLFKCSQIYNDFVYFTAQTEPEYKTEFVATNMRHSSP